MTTVTEQLLEHMVKAIVGEWPPNVSTCLGPTLAAKPPAIRMST